MPTFEGEQAFWRDYRRLSLEQRTRFRAAVRRFIGDVRAGQFRAGLRVKAVAGYDGVCEMTWAPDGRATFHYGAAVHTGEQHIVWRRVGAHDIFTNP